MAEIYFVLCNKKRTSLDTMSSFRWANLVQARLSHVHRTTKDRSEAMVGAVALLSVGIGITVSTFETDEEDAIAVNTPRQRCQVESSRPFPTHYSSLDQWRSLLLSQSPFAPNVTLTELDDSFPSHYSETERFFQTLEYHRCMLADYVRRWDGVDPGAATAEAITWPRNIPSSQDISALEMDLGFCLKEPAPACQKQQFRIASYYVMSKSDAASQQKGYRMVKELAEHGYPDGMCLYGMILNEGLVKGVDINTDQAVVWFRRCVDGHRHIKATYELAVALYTGEGVVENPEQAVKLFRRTAHLGLAGSAYILGECLLDGVGVERDRADALEWLTTAAELGHQLARKRVIIVLRQDFEKLHPDELEAQMDCKEEAARWMNAEEDDTVRQIIVERKFTVGGCAPPARNDPTVAARRKTKVQESREEDGTL